MDTLPCVMQWWRRRSCVGVRCSDLSARSARSLDERTSPIESPVAPAAQSMGATTAPAAAVPPAVAGASMIATAVTRPHISEPASTSACGQQQRIAERQRGRGRLRAYLYGCVHVRVCVHASVYVCACPGVRVCLPACVCECVLVHARMQI